MGQKTILVVDDDADLRLGLDVRLKANGYKVLLASDGEESIAVALASAPDLIILDLGLPLGDGYSVMQRLSESGRMSLIPVIVLSARERSTNRDRSLQVGAYTFLQKPAETAELIGAVQRALGQTPKKVKASDADRSDAETRLLNRILS